ncbi:MAG: hypothetical protein JKP98_04150 [Rhodobacteraceae bacterium]|nr:hypothetical protein [Paracoccaceae bacterium]
MTDATAAAPPRDLPDRALIAFLLMTFAITWGITGVWIFMPGPATALLGQLSATTRRFSSPPGRLPSPVLPWLPGMAGWPGCGPFCRGSCCGAARPAGRRS